MSGPLLVGTAAAAGVFLLRAIGLVRAHRGRRRLADTALLGRFGPVPRRGREWMAAGVLALGAGLVGAMAAGFGAREAVREKGAGPETVLLLDASNSMLAEDIQPSRLERQRELAGRLAARLSGNVGVVYFAGRGYVLSPLTADASAVRMYVQSVRPASVGRGGTALGAGLSEALGVLGGGRGETNRAIVLFSDGEETVEQPLDAALERARRSGVPVHAVAIGTREGGRIPIGPETALDAEPGQRRALDRTGPGGTESDSYLRGPDGEVVTTHLEEETLRHIAQVTGGRYLSGEEPELDQLADELAGGEAPEQSGGSPAIPLLLLAFALLWAEAFLPRATSGASPSVTGSDSETRESSHSERGRRPAASAAALLGIALALAVSAAAPAQDRQGAPSAEPSQDLRALPARESAETSRYRAEALRSGRPEDWYNLGTALLREGRWDEARETLRRAVRSESERVGTHGHYNHGLASALLGRRGQASAEARREALLGARTAFQDVLRRDPTDEDARWNLELVQRWLQQPRQSGGGGDGGQDGGGGGLDPEAAEALLDEAGRAEAELRERVLERGRLRDPAVERNW